MFVYLVVGISFVCGAVIGASKRPRHTFLLLAGAVILGLVAFFSSLPSSSVGLVLFVVMFLGAYGAVALLVGVLAALVVKTKLQKRAYHYELGTRPNAGSNATMIPLKIQLVVRDLPVFADLVGIGDESRAIRRFNQTQSNGGILEVFASETYQTRWKSEASIPTSVAYLSSTGRIVSIHEMKAFTEVPHQSAGPARFALEMNAEWFTNNAVNVGDTIRGLEKALSPK